MTNPFYGSNAWKGLRARVKAKAYKCGICQKIFSKADRKVIDHIKPRAKFPELALDITNLRALCESCHNSYKQRIELGQEIRQIGADGYPIDPK